MVNLPDARLPVDGGSARGDVVADGPLLVLTEELHVLVGVTTTLRVEVEHGLDQQPTGIGGPGVAVGECLR